MLKIILLGTYCNCSTYKKKVYISFKIFISISGDFKNSSCHGCGQGYSCDYRTKGIRINAAHSCLENPLKDSHRGEGRSRDSGQTGE